MTTVIRTAHTRASKEAVWDVLTRSADWSQWADVSSSIRVREGAEHPDGVGSVREVYAAGLLPIREEVITFEPGDGRYAYRLVSGMPVRDYVGEVQLTADETETQVQWTTTCRPLLPVPGADQVLGAALGVVVSRLLDGLVRAAERR